MDINEFSIACKLITNKLKGVEIPKVLPPNLTAGMVQAMPMMQPGMRMPAGKTNQGDFYFVQWSTRLTLGVHLSC